MSKIFFLYAIACCLCACNPETQGDLKRASEIGNTAIRYILQHPEEFKETAVTVKGRVISSRKLLKSKAVLSDESGKEITVVFPSGTAVPAENAEIVVQGKIMQGMKIQIGDIFDYNNIYLKVEE